MQAYNLKEGRKTQVITRKKRADEVEKRDRNGSRKGGRGEQGKGVGQQSGDYKAYLMHAKTFP